jgi:hypothetical protein
MILTPCMTGTEALFHHLADDGVTPDPGRGLLGVAVEAWDDVGVPLVAGRDKLVPVTSFRSNRFVFVRLAPSRFSASAPPDAEEPERFPVTDPDEPKDGP